ncbi:hypothetical protein NDU88_005970 [Pleurodeles waltl]|uniref:Uncharacterized protein n=1 Tax=Pleurodeles waltl TaxID=8319 RepID=A0AAV7WDG3_PLEWA|nr:hypothetical protein NDU88_005970 [Pleurodeles waltl]
MIIVTLSWLLSKAVHEQRYDGLSVTKLMAVAGQRERLCERLSIFMVPSDFRSQLAWQENYYDVIEEIEASEWLAPVVIAKKRGYTFVCGPS